MKFEPAFGCDCPAVSNSEFSAWLDVQAAKGRLISLAGRLLLKCQMSAYREDKPKSVPNYMLDNIERNNDRIKDIAAELRKIADSI
jgi:hypothetical protein